MLNVVAIMGRLARDPEMRQTTTGKNVASFRIACDRGRRDANGQSVADWIDVVAWDRQAEFVCRYFHKGNAIAIDGRIQVSNYTDKDGNKRRRFEVLADNVSFVEGKNASGASPAASGEPVQSQAGAPVSFESGNMDDFEEIDLGDDLPF